MTTESDIKEIIMDTPLGGRRARTGARTRKRRHTDTGEVVPEKEGVDKKVEKETKTHDKKKMHPIVILAPAKKRIPRLLLIPTATKQKIVPKKTFKAKRIRVTIDNTAKTTTRRNHVNHTVDSMTEEQLRAAVVAAKLSRKETVQKAPLPLLRQMLKDYRTMRGMLL
jgi:hypothetical protein